MLGIWILVWKYGFLWISVDFVWTLLDFSMELTKVCVELVWRLCFGVKFVWILNFGFIPTFGIDCRMVLCRVFGMFGAVFVACFVALIGRILWHVDKGCSGMVSSQKLTCTGAAKELSGMPVCGSHALKNFSPRVGNCVGFHAIA